MIKFAPATFSIIAILLSSLRLPAATPPRLAVISDSAENGSTPIEGTGAAASPEDFSAALTAELSHDPSFGLVERGELDRIASEKSLGSLLGKSEFQKVGALLNAQGLVIFNSSPAGEKAVEVRMVAVDSGVVLFDITLPPGQLAEEVAAIHKQVDRTLPKLLVRRGEAVGLSMLNLRATMETARSRDLERKLDAMLVSRLAAVPELFVLERRKLDALVSEKAFDPAIPGAFWNGAWLVDGSFDPISTENGKITVHVRLRSALNSTEKLIEATGEADQLPRLVEDITGKIARVTGGKFNGNSWQPAAEAEQYFEECVWATQRGLYLQALESAESAIALGETKADLVGLHAFLLAVRVTPTDETTSTADSDKPPPPADPDRLDDALRAIAEVQRYQDEGLEKQLVFFNTNRDVYFRTGDLLRLVLRRTTSYLMLLDQNKDAARAAILRDALRKLANYDPLAGKFPAEAWTAAEFGAYWSNDEAEWLAYWHLILYRDYSKSDGEVPLLHYLFRKQAEMLGDCFPLTPDQKQKHFDDFVAGLSSDPKTAAMALIIRSSYASKEPPEVKKQLFGELLDHIAKNHEPGLNFYLTIFQNPLLDQFPEKCAVIACYLLQHSSTLEGMQLFGLLKPKLIPEDQAAAIWQDLQDYKKRVIAAQTDPTTSANLMNTFRVIEDPIASKFPDAIPKTPLLPALAVSRFITPYDLPDQKTGEFLVQKTEVAGHSAWIVGMSTSGQRRMLEINLDTCVATPLPVLPSDGPDRQQIEMIRAIPGGLLALGFQNYQARMNPLNRYDEKTDQWTVRHFPLASPGSSAVLWANDHMYLTMHEQGMSGLLRYDWDSGKTTVLASSRRKPAQNQFDDRDEYSVTGVFAGPGGRVCAVMDWGVYYVREEPGNWDKAFDFDFAQSLTSEGRTLLFNWVGDVMLVDPAKPEPEPWMSRDKPVNRPVPGEPKALWKPRLAAWSGKALWRSPIDWNGNTASAERMGFTADDLFLLFKTTDIPARLALHWYWRGGPPGGLVVPLAFTVSPSTLENITAKLGDSTTYGGIKYLGTPGSDPMSVRMYTSANGLVIAPIRSGIWFIPFSDLQEFRKNPQAHAAPIPIAPAGDGKKTDDKRTTVTWQIQ